MQEVDTINPVNYRFDNPLLDISGKITSTSFENEY